jgi:hypothetical protein
MNPSVAERFTPNVGSFSSLQGATPSAALIADQILTQNRGRFGVDFDGINAAIAEANTPNDAGSLLARPNDLISELVGRLSPVEGGQLLKSLENKSDAAVAAPQNSVEKPKVAAPKASTSADFAVVASPKDAPSTIRFSSSVQQIFETQRQNSFPGGKSKEQGGTIVFDKKSGAVSIQNIGGNGSTSGSFSPNLTLKDSAKYGTLGIFHTHPYDKSEGSHTGVSLSGGDAAYLINNSHNVIVAQSGDRQFAFIRTAKTPASVDATALNDAQNNRIAELTTKGYTFPQASRIAAQETAVKYDLAYYQGSNGVLQRVDTK